MKPFPIYLRQNFRKAFWRAAIFWWALCAILTAGVAIVAVISGDFIAALVLLGIGMVGGGIYGAMASVLLTPLFLLVRWMRDVHEEHLDQMDLIEEPANGQDHGRRMR